MDLISIRRKYRNKRNTIAIIFFIIICIVLILVVKELQKQVTYGRICTLYSEQREVARSKEQLLLQQIQEEARKAKLPQLTDIGKNNVKNLYHSDKKRVFLTFDDGPSQNVTTRILDILKQENIKATFFVLGSRVELNTDVLKREYEEGHYIASHGYSHIYSQIYASPQSVIDEYNKSVIAIRNAIGEQEYNPHLFRFPGGYKGGKYADIKSEAAAILEQNDIMYVDWNSLTSDSAGYTTTEQFLTEIDKTVGKRQSVVVLMHDAGNKQTTADALPSIISYFRDREFEFENFYSIIK